MAEKKQVISRHEDSDWVLWGMMNYAMESMIKVRNNELNQYGVSLRQAIVLWAVGVLREEATPAEIAEWTTRKPNTISGIIDRMIKKGLLTKVRDPKKKSRVKVTLTEKGRRTRAEARKRESLKEMLSCLSDEEYSSLRLCLEKLLDQVHKIDPSLGRAGLPTVERLGQFLSASS